MKYKEVLHKCFDVLKEEKGLNYLICVCNATNPDSNDAIGGHAWNITDVKDGDSQPDFPTMVGGLIESYLKENGYSYTDKLKFINALYQELLEHVTYGGDGDGKVEE